MAGETPVGLPDQQEAALLWEAVPDGLLLVNTGGVISLANSAAHRLFGYRPGCLNGLTVEALVPNALRARHIELRRQFGLAPIARSMGEGTRLEGLRCDGTAFPVHISLTPWPVSHGTYTLAAVRDITSWVRSEQQLATVQRERVIADDHERIARDLHDNAIQELVAIGMELSAICSRVAPSAADRIRLVVTEIDHVINQIRSTVFGLSKPNPDAATVASEAISVINSYRTACDLDITLSLLGDLDLGLVPQVRAHFEPTLRELLSNVARHSKATSVLVEVSVRDSLVVSVTESSEHDAAQPGLIDKPHGGLSNLRDRAELLGGTFTRQLNDIGGMTATWRIPLPSNS